MLPIGENFKLNLKLNIGLNINLKLDHRACVGRIFNKDNVTATMLRE